MVKTAFALILLCLWSCTQSMAQADLKNRWISYSVTLRNREMKINDEWVKTTITFKGNHKYVKLFYSFENPSDSGRVNFAYDMTSKETTIIDENGETLKRVKVKERGVYRIEGDKILFVTGHQQRRAQYQLLDDDLLLKWIDVATEGEDVVIKYKRR